MDMRHIMTTLLALALCATATAQDFDKYFTDSTLRLDYIFEGNARQQHIAIVTSTVSLGIGIRNTFSNERAAPSASG